MPKPRGSGGRTTPRRTEPDEDLIEINPNGTITMEMSGSSYHLRRPKIGELRDFIEQLREVQALVAEANALVADETASRDAKDDARWAYNLAVLNWWREVVRVLDRTGQDLPEIDDCAPWLLSFPLIGEVRSSWESTPWGPGGSPTDRAAKLAAQTLAPLLNAQP